MVMPIATLPVATLAASARDIVVTFFVIARNGVIIVVFPVVPVRTAVVMATRAPVMVT